MGGGGVKSPPDTSYSPSNHCVVLKTKGTIGQLVEISFLTCKSEMS